MEEAHLETQVATQQEEPNKEAGKHPMKEAAGEVVPSENPVEECKEILEMG